MTAPDHTLNGYLHERIAHLEAVIESLRAENQRLRDELATTEAREWQRYPLGRV